VQLLLTVADTFAVTNTGLVVVPGPLHDDYKGPGKVEAELRKPDGSVSRAILTVQWFFQTPPPKEPRWGCVFQELSKTDVPVGTEVWI
jgi:hypothetical protein